MLVVAAVVAKQWAVLAILPAAMAAPRGGWRIAAAGAIGTGLLRRPPAQPRGARVHAAITNTGALFHPHQLFWPFGVPATPEFTAAGHGTRMGPGWLMPLTRPLIVAAGAAVAAAWWLRSGPDRNRDDVLGVLALVFLLRCMLDPWDLIYYHLPLVVSLAAWEARRGRDTAGAGARRHRGLLAHVRRLRRAQRLRALRRVPGLDDPARDRPRRHAPAARRRGASRTPAPQLAPGSRLTRQLPWRGRCPAAPTSAAPPSSRSTSTS